MTTFPGSPRMVRGGFILMDAAGRRVLRSVAFQYNPDSLSRGLTPRGAKAEGGDRLEALRLTGPATEVIRLEAEFDATDRLEKPRANPGTMQNGIAAELAEFEAIVMPRVADLEAAERLAATGTLEILPLPAPLLLFVFGKNRTLPVRITDISLTEEAFDTNLNPIRARIALTLRVLSSDDLAPGSKAAGLWLTSARRRERLVDARPSAMSALGRTGAS